MPRFIPFPDEIKHFTPEGEWVTSMLKGEEKWSGGELKENVYRENQVRNQVKTQVLGRRKETRKEEKIRDPGLVFKTRMKK